MPHCKIVALYQWTFNSQEATTIDQYHLTRVASEVKNCDFYAQWHEANANVEATVQTWRLSEQFGLTVSSHKYIVKHAWNYAQFCCQEISFSFCLALIFITAPTFAHVQMEVWYMLSVCIYNIMWYLHICRCVYTFIDPLSCMWQATGLPLGVLAQSLLSKRLCTAIGVYEWISEMEILRLTMNLQDGCSSKN